MMSKGKQSARDQADEVDEQVKSSEHGGESPERQESIVQFQAKTDDESKHDVPETKGQEAADIDDMEKELERIVAHEESLKVAEKSNFNMTCTDFRKDIDEKEVIDTVVKSSTVDDFRKNDNSKHVPYILQPEVEPQIEEFESRNLVPDGIKLSSGA